MSTLAVLELLLIILLTLGLFIKGWIGSSRHFDPFEPALLVGLVYFLYFALDAFVHVETLHLEQALGISLVGVASFVIGYAVTLNSKQSVRYSGMPKVFCAKCILRLSIVLYLLGILATLYSMASGNFFGQFRPDNLALAPYLSYLSQLRFLGFLLFVIYSLSLRKRKSILLIAIPLSIEILLSVVTSSKQFIVYPLLSIFIMYHYIVRRVQMSELGLLALLVAPLFAVTYAIREVWGAYFYGSQILLENLIGFMSAIPAAVMNTPLDEWGNYMLDVAMRFHGVYSLDLILSQPVPEGYANYSGVKYFYSLLVPRFLDPNKPSFGYQIMFGHEYAGIPNAIDVLIPPTQIGVFYLDYGIIGVVAGQLFFGALVAVLYKWMKAKVARGDYLVLPFYIIMLIQVLKVETNPFELANSVLRLMIVGIPLYILIMQMSQPSLKGVSIEQGRSKLLLSAGLLDFRKR